MYICKKDSNINESGILWGPLPIPLSDPQVLAGGGEHIPEVLGKLPSCFLCFEGSGVVAFCLEQVCRLVPPIWWEYYLILVICLSFSSLFYWVSMAGGCHGDYRVAATTASVAGPAAFPLQPHWLPRGSSMFLPPGLCIAPLCLFFCFLNIFPFMRDFKHIEVEK